MGCGASNSGGCDRGSHRQIFKNAPRPQTERALAAQGVTLCATDHKALKILYLDNAATTPIDPGVRAAMQPWLEADFGNPSARYPLGVRAAEAVDRARARIARACGARPRNVTFTAGGTEANNLALLGVARARRKLGQRIVVGSTEHPSVRESARALTREGFDVRWAPVASDGGLDLAGTEELLDEHTILVSHMLVNNEFGTLYPIRELARRVRRRAPHAALHVDAVQGLGKLELSLEELDADSLALSAHKVHAPKGVGALVTRQNLEVEAIIHGGGQEGGLRSGTENVAGIVAFGEAARLADERIADTQRATAAARGRFRALISELPGIEPLEPGAQRVEAIQALIVPGAPAEVWLHHLEARGVFASAGSACQARKEEVSPAYGALGLDLERARRVLRFSFSRTSTMEEALAAAGLLGELIAELG